MFKVLVVEDDMELNKSMCVFLNNKGFDAVGCFNADDAFDKMYEAVYDIIISDIMMPSINGFEFVKTIRNLNDSIPIIFVTAKDDFDSKQIGFRLGVDDYMVKPVDLNELYLRMGALLRRAKIVNSRKLVVGDFVMDSEEHSAYYQGEEIVLTKREFNLLYKLLSYPKKTFTRSHLMEEFWSAESESGPRTVDVYITKLRAKVSMCTSFEIVTVHGMGYKAVIKDEQ